MKYKHIVFDIDGTLIDTEYAVLHSLQETIKGLCEYLGGKYISYTEEKPITMNPFNITKAELNIEKIDFLKNQIGRAHV